mmetsp:Transcript_77352/g.149394  ORF Transcript_77352/g.149394 Transcript_77352/m.149394 type:complete len:82 (-) Transcript_77352:151-396(-)
MRRRCRYLARMEAILVTQLGFQKSVSGMSRDVSSFMSSKLTAIASFDAALCWLQCWLLWFAAASDLAVADRIYHGLDCLCL